MLTRYHVIQRQQLATFLGTVALSVLAVLLVQHLLTTPRARAQSTAGSSACSNATLSGSYGAQVFGINPTGSDGVPVAGGVWFSQVNLTTFDGAGNASKSWPTAGTATYTVNPDCTFSIAWSGSGRTLSGVLMDGGRKAFVIPTPGADQAITWERQ